MKSLINLLLSALLTLSAQALAEQKTEYNFAKASFSNYLRKNSIAMAKPQHDGVLTPFICSKKEDALKLVSVLQEYSELPPIVMKSVAYAIRDEMRQKAKQLSNGNSSCKVITEAKELLSQRYIVKQADYKKGLITIRNWQSKKVSYLPAARNEGIVYSIQQTLATEMTEGDFSRLRKACGKVVKC